MPSFITSQLIQYSASDMFSLVADVQKYPQFVPLCQALSIHSEQKKASCSILIADMTVGYKSIYEKILCQVVLNPQEALINVNYIDGPFKYLKSEWRFLEKTTAECDVYFFLDYEFKSQTLSMLMKSMFDQAFSRFIKAFEERATQIYGTVP
ncbi:type II toxin-antitoxin system RatA family toxin [Candidatus Endowatersipora endosymbiont of Watersipora subatra]|uniref:type II toxin-antitoxin system RatA family toxin n=1 Tax=Candidatus Endowatersipora endosymbiont of Watersipora subatra TaxID=3077946 RepID=UPI00312C9138